MKLKLTFTAILAMAFLAFTSCSHDEKKEEAMESNTSAMSDTTMHEHEHMHGDSTHSHSHEHEGDTTMHAH